MPLQSNSPGNLDVIVVGAGALGCSTAWHLQRHGCRVLVLDSSRGPARQSTLFAAGFVGCLSGVHNPAWGRDLAELQLYGIEFYRRLAADSREDLGYRPVGCAYVFLSEEGFAAHLEGVDASRQYGCEVEVLTKDRAGELLPEIQFDHTRGIIFLRDSIRVRAGNAIAALAAEAAAAGVQFRFDEPVQRLLIKAGQIEGVSTASGTYYAPQVVVAAGAWTRPLIEQHGIPCPAEPCVETRFTTRPISQISTHMPLLVFRDWQRLYLREEFGGLLIGGGDHLSDLPDRNVDPRHPPSVDDIPPHQAYRVRNLLREIEHVMPALREVEIAEIGSGLPTFTADKLFIVDEIPNCRGAFVVARCQEAGVTHGPGLGRRLAEWVAVGTRAPVLNRFRLSRFSANAS